jgi:ribosomal protein S18 acetylase RimI-like enzyme
VPGTVAVPPAALEQALRTGLSAPQVLTDGTSLLAAAGVGVREQGRERIGEIRVLCRAPELRGKGLGDHVLQRAAEALLALGATRLELEVAASNGPARRLYERHGFRVTREMGIWRLVSPR